MNNQIANEEIKVQSGTLLNEKDYLHLTLSYLKDIEKNMCISITEASNENLAKIYYNMYNDISLLQRKAYETSFKYGWYVLSKAEKPIILDKYNKLLQELETLSN